MVCKAGLSTVRKLWLTRHGQSEYNRKHLLGGNSSISEDGEKYAELLPGALLSRLPQAEEQVSLSVWTSTLKRTIQTARHLPFPKLQWKALDEIDAGACDGMTYEDIARDMPEEFAARKKDKLRYRYPAGESYLDVVQRLEPVITEMEREREYVCIVSHQAVLRVIYGYFMGVPLEQIPSLEIPLHTLIELTPLPDGTMHEQRFRVDTARGPEQFAALSAGQFAEDVAAALTAGALNEMSGITNSDTDTLLKVGSPVDSSLANNHNHTAGTASGASCSTSTSSLSPQGGDQRSSPIRQSVGNNLAATDSMMIAPAATDAAALGLADSSSSTQLAAQGELAA